MQTTQLTPFQAGFRHQLLNLASASPHLARASARFMLPMCGPINGVSETGDNLPEQLIALNDPGLIAVLLKNGWDPADQAVSGWSGVTHAVDQKAYAALKAMLDADVHPDTPNGNGMTALMIAARQNDLEAMDLLLKAGANPNAADRAGWTAAHWTVHKDRPLTMEVLEKLRRAGANLFTASFLDGRTCFDLGVRFKDELAVLRAQLSLVKEEPAC
ncbi:ankyrin repeat protein [Roseateles asaccharophilus]|uniref:ankyrin repeat domain-containing protein n=1 Tax=Roseateles asaccharophilus TaxID=582607 RepID=UPI003837D324